MPLEIIFEHTVDDEALAIVDRLLINFIPKLGLEQNITKRGFSRGNSSSQSARGKPGWAAARVARR